MLRPGITGHLASGNFATRGGVSFTDFKAVVFSAARAIRATVVHAEPAGVTPNFHSAVLNAPDGETVVLCNSGFPIVAFAEAPVAMGSLRFKDHAALRDAMESIGGYTVTNVAELDRPFTEDDGAALGSGDLAQLRYWKPSTVGEVVFNWFD
jgi:hypothetical protein